MTFGRLLLPGFALLVILGATATAQELQTQTPPQPNQSIDLGGMQRGIRRREMRMRRERMAIARQLNLTDEQRRQAQAIRQRFIAATRPQREQLFQLREKRLAGTFSDQDMQLAMNVRREMRTAKLALRQEKLATLTMEQRTKLETLRQQRKELREMMIERRREFMRSRPIN
ncbi:MAG: hypothetical protein C5B55_11575 [Blastocatellia bacterium]|nr:MAG: hypothetical protein C5B55_11575 [Blastocatellia bacterium]